jgi:peptidoglycan hydrolase CwlO-like protein
MSAGKDHFYKISKYTMFFLCIFLGVILFSKNTPKYVSKSFEYYDIKGFCNVSFVLKHSQINPSCDQAQLAYNIIENLIDIMEKCQDKRGELEDKIEELEDKIEELENKIKK